MEQFQIDHGYDGVGAHWHTLLTTGRRRPFMVAGSALVAINLLIIGWTREIGAWFLDVDSEHYQTLVIWIAVVSVYLLDFAINAGTYFFQLF